MFIEKLPNLGCIPDYIARIWIWIRYVSDTRICHLVKNNDTGIQLVYFIIAIIVL